MPRLKDLKEAERRAIHTENPKYNKTFSIPTNPHLYTVKEAAQIVGFGESAMKSRGRSGAIPCVMYGNQMFFRKSLIEQIKDDHYIP